MARDQLNILLQPKERAMLEAILENERAKAGELGIATGKVTAGSVLRMWIRNHHKELAARGAAPTKRKT